MADELKKLVETLANQYAPMGKEDQIFMTRIAEIIGRARFEECQSMSFHECPMCRKAAVLGVDGKTRRVETKRGDIVCDVCTKEKTRQIQRKDIPKTEQEG